MDQQTQKQPRRRRAFTPEQKADAVRLCRQGGRTVRQVAGDLELTESALRLWLKCAERETGASVPGGLASEERAELARLRREVERLEMERAILQKATAFFAREST